MEPTPGTPPSNEPGEPPGPPSSPIGFAAVLAILGAAVLVAASLLPYAASVGQEGRLIDFDAPVKVWIWSAVSLWGTALAILITGMMLIPSRGHRVLIAGLLIAFGVETIFLYGPILGQVVVLTNLDPRAGSFLGVLSGPIVLAGGIMAYRARKATG
jgi:hypothetical protein